jgi:Fe-S-cluster-containing dehydrogenase component/formate-dependent nitrite reductase membrane component NrfD
MDQRRCIGCHACTVACKQENQVPLGAFRTWVKYVEKGSFPDTRRYFSVLRCNHCDDAPCVTICPTVALYRRDDGIVDFARDRCIGCKSCMQACPYDALYIDPNTQTAAKCNYCSHRIEVGLEPACAIVCPATAIIAGDLDDPASRIARLVAREQVEVRKVEQGTRPKVYYIGAESSGLTPQMQRHEPAHMWGQRPPAEMDLIRMVANAQAVEGNGDGALSRTVYDAPHMPHPWGWKVSAYLWAKSVSAGALMVGALATLFDVPSEGFLVGVAAPLVALLFLVVTAGLLVFDLKRPDRFHYILFKGNRTSWLVWGAYILMAYGAVAAAWLFGGLTGNAALLRVLALPTLALGVAAAGYSAFLFSQAEGRDFWQSPVLLPQLLVSALGAGAASLIVVGVAVGAYAGAVGALRVLLVLALLGQGLVFFAELFGSHASVDVARAARLITRGPRRGRFWIGVVLLGIFAPVVLSAWGPLPGVLGALCALVGLWIYEDLWVEAGQSIPLS